MNSHERQIGLWYESLTSKHMARSRQEKHTTVVREIVDATVARNVTPRDLLVKCCIRLPLIAWAHAGDALTKTVDKKPLPWVQISRHLLYVYWAERIERVPLVPADDGPTTRSRRGLYLLDALAVGQDELARWFGQNLRRWRRELGRAWEPDRVENFALWLFTRWSGDSPPPEEQPLALGAYEALATAWESGGEPLRAAISDACDWRMEHTLADDPEDETFEWGFDEPPYILYPAEILALERVRRSQGLDTPRPDHALLRTPAAHLPQFPLPLPDDSLIDRVVAAVRKVYPGL